MHEYSFLFAIAGILVMGAMSPGPSFMVVAQNAIAKSRAHGIATAFGTAMGVTLFAVLASVGVTALLEASPKVFLAFKICGGLYLIYLAMRIWIGSSQPLASISQNSHNDTVFKAFLSGLITQCSNPKTALVIAGIFAAFVPMNPPRFTMILVAAIVFLIDFAWYVFVAVVLSNARSKSVYSRAKTSFDRVAAGFLGLVGVRLIFSN